MRHDYPMSTSFTLVRATSLRLICPTFYSLSCLKTAYIFWRFLFTLFTFFQVELACCVRQRWQACGAVKRVTRCQIWAYLLIG